PSSLATGASVCSSAAATPTTSAARASCGRASPGSRASVLPPGRERSLEFPIGASDRDDVDLVARLATSTALGGRARGRRAPGGRCGGPVGGRGAEVGARFLAAPTLWGRPGPWLGPQAPAGLVDDLTGIGFGRATLGVAFRRAPAP